MIEGCLFYCCERSSERRSTPYACTSWGRLLDSTLINVSTGTGEANAGAVILLVGTNACSTLALTSSKSLEQLVSRSDRSR